MEGKNELLALKKELSLTFSAIMYNNSNVSIYFSPPNSCCITEKTSLHVATYEYFF